MRLASKERCVPITLMTDPKELLTADSRIFTRNPFSLVSAPERHGIMPVAMRMRLGSQTEFAQIAY